MDDLVEAAVVGPAGWHRLWRTLEPILWELVDRPRFASHLTHTEDRRRRIVGTVRTLLATGHLQVYLDARDLRPNISFLRWLRTLAKRVAMHPPSAEVSLRRRSSAAAPRGSARSRR